MIYHRPAQLALQALFYLALDGADRPRLVREIAAALGAQAPYLTKVFQQLQRAGLVRTARGPGGGVRLARPAEEITLWDVISALEPAELFEQCVLGLPRCSEQTPCPLHPVWVPIRAQLLALLKTKTVAEMARESQRGGLLPWLDRARAAGAAQSLAQE